jgi:ABC-type nitrate/sulfonate/bicarbonate transport system substrate-binding protein
MKTTRILVGIIVVIGVMISGCVQQVEKPTELEKATLGAESSLLPAAVWVAENKGYFQEQGLDLTIKEFDSGKASLLAMLEGDEGIDISTVAPTPIMFNSFDRQDFSIFATFVYSYDDVKVIARKDKGITTVVDLRGKKIGTPAGTTGQFFVEAFLIHTGLSASEVEVVDIAPSDLPEALNSGQVDAIVIWEPHGYNAKKLLGDKAIRLPSSDVYKETFNFMVMNDFAEENPEILKKFLRAVDKATTFIKNYKEESQDIVAKRLNLDREVMDALWDEFVFGISLQQSLIVTLEDEARWAIKNNLTGKTKVPNYLGYIYLDALYELKPDSVNIIH